MVGYDVELAKSELKKSFYVYQMAEARECKGNALLQSQPRIMVQKAFSSFKHASYLKEGGYSQPF
jgi:hypothetical protein